MWCFLHCWSYTKRNFLPLFQLYLRRSSHNRACGINILWHTLRCQPFSRAKHNSGNDEGLCWKPIWLYLLCSKNLYDGSENEITVSKCLLNIFQIHGIVSKYITFLAVHSWNLHTAKWKLSWQKVPKLLSSFFTNTFFQLFLNTEGFFTDKNLFWIVQTFNQFLSKE